jgi:hypothetical protein
MRDACVRLIAALAVVTVTIQTLGIPLAAANTSDDRPSPDEIMSRAVKAMGGEDAIGKINTLHTVMDMAVQNMTVQLECSWSRKGGRLTRTVSPMATMELCTDGTLAWSKGPGGVHLMSEQQAKELEGQAGMFMNLLEPQRTVRDQGMIIENAGKQFVDGRECWQLQYVNKNGDKGSLYFDVKSGLPAAFETVRSGPGQDVRVRMLVTDWKDVEGVQFFQTIDMENSSLPGGTPDTPGRMPSMRVTKIEINTVDKSVFAAPEEAKKLAASRPPASPPATQPAAKEISINDLTPDQRKRAEQMIEGVKRAADVQVMKQMLAALEPAMGHLPADQKPAMQYVVQELKKEIARLGG